MNLFRRRLLIGFVVLLLECTIFVPRIVADDPEEPIDKIKITTPTKKDPPDECDYEDDKIPVGVKWQADADELKVYIHRVVNGVVQNEPEDSKTVTLSGSGTTTGTELDRPTQPCNTSRTYEIKAYLYKNGTALVDGYHSVRLIINRSCDE